jgi:hypothetical protein
MWSLLKLHRNPATKSGSLESEADEKGVGGEKWNDDKNWNSDKKWNGDEK